MSEGIPSSQFFCSSTVEMIVVNVYTRPPILLCCLYIPPASTEVYLQEVIASLSGLPSQRDLIIVGDFNAPDINWLTLTAESPSSKKICEFVFLHNLMQLIEVPTHVNGNILDLVLTNCPGRITNMIVEEHPCLSVSDHCLIKLGMSSSKDNITHGCDGHYFNFTKDNMVEMDEFLLESDLSYIMSYSNVDQIWECIKGAIVYACNEFIPKIPIKKHSRPKWFNAIR